MVFAAGMERVGEGCRVLDLGCGCGMLSIGAALMGASHVLGVDIDPEALQQARENVINLDIGGQIEFLNANVMELLSDGILRCESSSFGDKVDGKSDQELFDTVLLNPPFGTKNNCGVDVSFLLIAMRLARKAVYSLHKSSTRDYVLKKVQEANNTCKVSVLAEIRFEIKNQFRFHRQKKIYVDVDLIEVSFEHQV